MSHTHCTPPHGKEIRTDLLIGLLSTNNKTFKLFQRNACHAHNTYQRRRHDGDDDDENEEEKVKEKQYP